MKRIFTGAMLIALGCMPVGAAAETAAVRYGDLNLSSPEGRAALNNRVGSAAKRVCMVDHHPGSSLRNPKRLACARAAQAGSEAQMAAAIEKAATPHLARATK